MTDPSATSMQSFPNGFRAVVFGAGGGIGSAFFSALQSNPACSDVIALGRATTPRIDLEDEATIEAAASHVAEGGPVHLVIDATGLLHDAAMRPEKSIEAVSPDTLARAFAVNAIGPLLLLKHFHRLLPKHGRSVFATLSARVGSIADNRLGGWYGYRASKAALNMFLRTAAIEIARRRPDAVCLALHPGTVRTRLSDPFAGDRERFEPQHAAAMLLRVMDEAEAMAPGAFRAYDGSEIPW